MKRQEETRKHTYYSRYFPLKFNRGTQPNNAACHTPLFILKGTLPLSRASSTHTSSLLCLSVRLLSHDMLLPTLVLASCVFRFATFATHTPPPMVQKTITKPLSDFGIDSALSSCCTLICWEDNYMHYFLYNTDDTLLRCIWGTPTMSMSRKAVVLANMRCWYAKHANSNITLAVQTEGLSWMMSTLLLMERE